MQYLDGVLGARHVRSNGFIGQRDRMPKLFLEHGNIEAMDGNQIKQFVDCILNRHRFLTRLEIFRILGGMERETVYCSLPWQTRLFATVSEPVLGVAGYEFEADF